MFRQGQLAVHGLAILLGRNEAGISNRGKKFLHHAVQSSKRLKPDCVNAAGVSVMVNPLTFDRMRGLILFVVQKITFFFGSKYIGIYLQYPKRYDLDTEPVASFMACIFIGSKYIGIYLQYPKRYYLDTDPVASFMACTQYKLRLVRFSVWQQ